MIRIGTTAPPEPTREQRIDAAEDRAEQAAYDALREQVMTGDEYIALLVRRQEEHMRVHPPVRPWMRPLLEWFIQPGDEALFTPPTADGAS